MTWLEIAALILAGIGIIGCIVPALPGPPISYLGLLCVYFNNQESDGQVLPLSLLITWGVVTIVITVLDYVVPALLTKATGGHKAASTGALLGMIAGIFFTPIGMIAGSLLGAFIGELSVPGSDPVSSFKAALGTFVGFIVGTVGKLICSGIMLFLIIKYLL